MRGSIVGRMAMSGAVTNDRPARRSGRHAGRSPRRRSHASALTERYKALFYAIVFLVVYGSLYPFNFSLSDTNLLGVKATVDFWRITTSRGDILGNLALFVPFGCAGMLALAPHRSRALRLVLLLVLGFAATFFADLRSPRLPPWYKALRKPLTLVAILCLAASYAALAARL